MLAQSGGAPAPDIGAGKKRAAACFACHNVDGISKIPGTPHLAGQERAYRDGLTRQNAVMNAMAKPLSDRDITNIAAYLQPPGYVAVATSSTPGLAAATTSGAAVTAPTAEISPRSGDAVYQASCVACHAAGVAGAPKLADKSASKPRIAQGLPTLQKHALQGLNAMPIASRDAINRSARLKTDPRWLANKRTIADLGPPQFATVQRRIHARGEHPPRRPMA